MAIFWLNSNGSNTAPFDTKEKGAHTIEDIRTQSVATTDTIMVARGSVTTDAVFNGPSCNKVCNIVAEDDGVNDESTRPIINYTVTGGPFFAGTTVTNDILLSGIKFVSTNTVAPDFTTTFDASYKLKFTDCIIEKPVNGDSFVETPIDFDRCVVKSAKQTTPLIIVKTNCSIKSSTIISDATSYIISSNGGTLIDVVIYAQNNSFVVDYATYLSNSVATNVICYGVGAKPIGSYDPLNTNVSISNVQFIDPKFNLTTYRYASDSPALGVGTLLSNIGWDQITQKASAVAIKFAVGSSSYFGNEFFPPYTGGVGSVPHAF